MRVRWSEFILLSVCMLVFDTAAGATEQFAPILNAPPQLAPTEQVPSLEDGFEAALIAGGDQHLAPVVVLATPADLGATQVESDSFAEIVSGTDQQQLAPVVNATSPLESARQPVWSSLSVEATKTGDQQLAPIVNLNAGPFRRPRPLPMKSGLTVSTPGADDVQLTSGYESSVLTETTVAEIEGLDGGDGTWAGSDTESAYGDACEDGQCATECSYALDCSCPDCCRRQFFVFGEFTYLRPRNAGISYGVPIDGPIDDPPVEPPIQIGSVGVVDPDYQSGYRAGVGVELDSSRMVLGRFWRFQSSTWDSMGIQDPNVIRSLVSHPSSSSAATDFLQASARYDIDFDLVDVDFQYLWRGGCDFALNYFVGARYAGMDQEFEATFVNSGVEQVATDIGFHGGGVRLGLEGVRFARYSGLHVYGRSAASFVGGQFRARYSQGQSFDPSVVETSWDSGRVVTMLDFEAGLGWQSCEGRVRITAGYAFSAWLNAVTTDDVIKATRTNSFVGMDSSLSFDGLMTGVEVRF